MKVRRILLILLAISPILMIDCTEPTSSEPFFEQLEEWAVAGVEMPGVVFVDALRAPEYIHLGRLKSIPPELIDSDFHPQLLEYFQRDGQTYAFPQNVQVLAMVVNVDLFKEADIDLESVQALAAEGKWTWDNFKEVAVTLTEPGSDVYGVGLTPGFWNFAPFLFQAGAPLFDESGMLLLDTAEAKDALSFYVTLYQDRLAFPPVEQWPLGEWPYWGAYDAMLEAFADNRIGMFIAAPSMYDKLLDRMELDPSDPSTSERVRVIELPVGRTGIQATVGQVRGFGLFGEPDESALTFLEFATSVEGMGFWIGDSRSPSSYVPARQSLQSAWLEVHPNTTAFVAGIDYMGFYQPRVASFEAMVEFDQLASDTIGDAMLGEIMVEEALDTLQTEGNDILEREQSE